MGLIARYAAILRASWAARGGPTGGVKRTPLERQFLPAALEIIDTPAPALSRAIMWTSITALMVALLWATSSTVDVVAIAPGKVIAAGKTKVIQPAETAVVKRILVSDGQAVQAGQVLLELEAAATATVAETARIREALTSARLEAARYDALSRAAAGVEWPTLRPPAGASKTLVEAETRAMLTQYQEQRAKLAAVDAEIARRNAELGSTERLVDKLSGTTELAQRRAEDYRNLVKQNFVSQHGYLEREQVRLEQEGDLAFHRAKAKELAAAVEESRRRRDGLVAEFERTAVAAKIDTDKRAALLEQDLVKARVRQNQQVLTAPVDGTVQQLAVHTIGGVVTPAQPLMVIAPRDYEPEVEAVLENKDVGFVKAGQSAHIKVETFSFTRYGTLPGTVVFVSTDAVADERKGLIFQARIKFEKASIQVDQRELPLTPGMAVSAEIAIEKRRVIEFFLDPIRKTVSQGLRER